VIYLDCSEKAAGRTKMELWRAPAVGQAFASFARLDIPCVSVGMGRADSLIAGLPSNHSSSSPAAPPRRLLGCVRDRLALGHYSPRTAEAYVGWIRRFILFNGRRHPSEMGAAEVSAFFSNLATERKVCASTQNQALAALLFLYADVLGRKLELASARVARSCA